MYFIEERLRRCGLHEVGPPSDMTRVSQLPCPTQLHNYNRNHNAVPGERWEAGEGVGDGEEEVKGDELDHFYWL